MKYDYNLIRGPLNKGDWPAKSFKWLVTIDGQQFDYYTGIGRVKPNGSPKPPSLDDVLFSLILDGSACENSFEDWCNDFGYSTDSRKALKTYLLCQENYNKLRKTTVDIEKERIRLEEY